MDLMYAVIEAVVISFFVGAILGGVIATHLSHKRQEQDVRHDVPDMQPVKIKVKDR
ncbi:MAG: hypothetical protein OEZ43_01190 [Gammaproteobacteria bacterium]|nr:hypothetical protein [Gammaproteobacteria bacterium]